MIYWIADGDVSSALSLKKKLQAEKFFQQNLDVVEVFYELKTLLEKFHEVNKKKSEKPRALIIDPYTLGDQDFAELYPIWSAWREAVVMICMTAMSLGRLELIYARREIVLLSFLKSELTTQWDLIRDTITAELDKQREPSAPLRSPQLRATEESLKKQIREFEKSYYQSGQLDAGVVREFVENQVSQAKTLGLNQLGVQLEKLTHLFAQQRSPGLMRVRKEIKEYLLLAHQVFTDLQG